VRDAGSCPKDLAPTQALGKKSGWDLHKHCGLPGGGKQTELSGGRLDNLHEQGQGGADGDAQPEHAQKRRADIKTQRTVHRLNVGISRDDGEHSLRMFRNGTDGMRMACVTTFRGVWGEAIGVAADFWSDWYRIGGD